MIIKQFIGQSIYLGGKPDEIEPLHFSCFNFNNNFNVELTNLSDNFAYFVISDKDYIHARSKNIHYNWKYSDKKGNFLSRYRRTRMARLLAIRQAKHELESYPIEKFIDYHQINAYSFYSLGSLPTDLEKINNEVFETEIKDELVKLDDNLFENVTENVTENEENA